MQNIKTGLGIIGLISLLAIILGTPAAAGAQEQCQTRPLDQGSGNVKICVSK